LQLNSIHNLTYLQRLMGDLREAILEGELGEFRERFWAEYETADAHARRRNRENWGSRRASMATQ